MAGCRTFGVCCVHTKYTHWLKQLSEICLHLCTLQQEEMWGWVSGSIISSSPCLKPMWIIYIINKTHTPKVANKSTITYRNVKIKKFGEMKFKLDPNSGWLAGRQLFKALSLPPVLLPASIPRWWWWGSTGLLTPDQRSSATWIFHSGLLRLWWLIEKWILHNYG